MQSSALETFDRYEKQALDKIRRMNIMGAGLEVKASRMPGGVNDIPLGMSVDDTAALA